MLGAVTVSVESLDAVVDTIASKYRVDPNLVKAVIKHESNWDVNASRYETHLNDTSWGLMQVLLKTAKWILNNDKLTIQDLIKPNVNIEAGTKYLGYLLGKYPNVNDVMAAYNAGSPRRNKDGSYVNQAYVDRVSKYYAMYKLLGSTGTKIATNPISLGALGLVGVVGLVLATRK